MSRLPNVELAIAKKEDQLRRAALLSEEHLTILAADKGRFADDQFRIFYHELQLRIALKSDPNIDVSYARIKMNEYAEELISVIMTQDLSMFHQAACQLPEYKHSFEKVREERERSDYFSRQNLLAIKRLANRI